MKQALPMDSEPSAWQTIKIKTDQAVVATFNHKGDKVRIVNFHDEVN